MKKIFKKGEITTTQIVTTILILASFIILWFLLNRFYFSSAINKEVCHESVILRATLPFGDEYVPLKCESEKVCATSRILGVGDCTYAKDRDKEKAKVKTTKDVERLFADKILDCWSMMGEGKVSLFTKSLAQVGVPGISSNCVICSRINFDAASFDADKFDWTEMDILKYMQDYKVPGEQISYINYITGDSPARINPENIGSVDLGAEEPEEFKITNVAGVGEAEVSQEILDKLEQAIANNEVSTAQDIIFDYPGVLKLRDKDGFMSLHYSILNSNLEAVKLLVESGADIMAKDSQGKTAIDLAQQISDEKIKNEIIKYLEESLPPMENKNPPEFAIVFMQISAPAKWDVWKNLAKNFGFVGGASLAAHPVGTIKFSTSALKMCSSSPWICAGIVAIAGATIQTSAWYNQELALSKCEDVMTSKDEARQGCSAIRVVKYDLENIKKYCGELAGA